MESRIIATAGKGGVGKTTISTLMLKIFIQRGIEYIQTQFQTSSPGGQMMPAYRCSLAAIARAEARAALIIDFAPLCDSKELKSIFVAGTVKATINAAIEMTTVISASVKPYCLVRFIISGYWIYHHLFVHFYFQWRMLCRTYRFDNSVFLFKLPYCTVQFDEPR